MFRASIDLWIPMNYVRLPTHSAGQDAGTGVVNARPAIKGQAEIAIEHMP